MTAFLVQFALSNLLASIVLAAIAYAVHRTGRYPVLSHLLWVLVLVKLITPPLLSLPVAHIPSTSGLFGGAGFGAGASVGLSSATGSLAAEFVAGLLAIWAIGSLLVLVVSLVRIYRFDRLLRRTSREAPGWISFMAEGAAARLGLDTVPRILVTSARLSPMTWWAGGRVQVVLPHGLAQDIQADQLTWVLGHELAHVKRHDHVVRWLEWLACVSFWWNPVAWWARRNLRLDEEASCDALVIEQLGLRPRSYARALLAVVEHLARPALQPPAVATGIDGGVSLERRFQLIIKNRSVRRAPRWLAIGLVGAVVALLPLGVGFAADPGSAIANGVAPSTNTVSASERAFLRGEGRAAAQLAQASTRGEHDSTTAKLSATVKAKSGAKAGAKAKRSGTVKTHKERLRAKRARARRRAEREATRVAPARAIEQVRRSTPI